MIGTPSIFRLARCLVPAALLLLPTAAFPGGERKPVGVLRVRVATPLRLSLSAGGILDPRGFRPDCRLTCDVRGPLVQAELGTGGAQLAAGYGAIVGDRKRSAAFAERIYVGFAVKGALLRTWDGAGLGPGNRWLAGLELEATITTVNFSLAALRDLSGGDRPDWRLAGGLGWGF